MLSPSLILRHLCVSCTLLNSTDPRTQGSLPAHRCLLPFVLRVRGSIKEQLVITSNCFLKPTASDRADLCSVNGGILVRPLTLEHSEMHAAFEKGPKEK